MRLLLLTLFLTKSAYSKKSKKIDDLRDVEGLKGLIDGTLSCLNEDDRIIGGAEADRLTWRWIVYFEGLGCGGAIVNPNLVVTAAHCCKDDWGVKKLRDYRFYVGMHSKSHAYNRKLYIPRKIKIHDDFNKNNQIDNDLCIVIPSEPIEYNSEVTPVCLSTEPPVVGSTCYIAGWGVTDVNTAVKAENLQEVEVNIISHETCTSEESYGQLPDFTLFEESQFCAGHMEGGKDACNGDSGGPLMCIEGGKPVLQGMVSFGKGCAEQNFPGVYTKMSAFTDWINQEIDSALLCPVKSIPTYNGLFKESNWSCAGDTTKGCTYRCDDGYVCAKTSCKMNGLNQWKAVSKGHLRKADCSRCDTVPEEFKLEGDGNWECTNKGSKKVCKIKCNTGMKRSAELSCNRAYADSWSLHPKKGDVLSCVYLEPCSATDANRRIGNRWPGYTFENFTKKDDKRYTLYAEQKCPNDETKSAKQISIGCRVKNGREQWKLKGNPTTNVNNKLKGCWSRRILGLV